mmetsp:Transcript_24411/g.59238  ORF Transcript_24411/g.59238 Transcript_24411/m.59238 type:complete len:166 (+) Transcript_24411:48-545(+)
MSGPTVIDLAALHDGWASFMRTCKLTGPQSHSSDGCAVVPPGLLPPVPSSSAYEALLKAEWARAQLVQLQAEQEIALARYRMAQLAVLGSAVPPQPAQSRMAGQKIAERVQPLETICPEKLAQDVMICRKSRKSRRRRQSERSTIDSDSANVSEFGPDEKENRSI